MLTQRCILLRHHKSTRRWQLDRYCVGAKKGRVKVFLKRLGLIKHQHVFVIFVSQVLKTTAYSIYISTLMDVWDQPT
jgi:hypothetical protein